MSRSEPSNPRPASPANAGAGQPAQRPAADVRRPTDEAARTLARQLMTIPHAALATLEPGTGWPLASRVSVAKAADLPPLILISRLSAHYAALEADPRCSLLFGEPGEGDPLRHPRITVLCVASKVASAERAAAKQAFLARHPAADMYADFADFDFWWLVPERASLNAGFGKAYSLTAEDLI